MPGSAASWPHAVGRAAAGPVAAAAESGQTYSGKASPALPLTGGPFLIYHRLFKSVSLLTALEFSYSRDDFGYSEKKLSNQSWQKP